MIEEAVHPGFTKYHLNRHGEKGWPFRPVLHRFTTPDIGDPHDHPFDIDVHVLLGSYVEEVYDVSEGGIWWVRVVRRQHGDRFIVPATRIHQIVALPDGECWTCCQYGPKERDFRFWRFNSGRPEYRVWNETEWKGPNP